MPAATPDASDFSAHVLAALFQPVVGDTHIALAVSGGSDSLALLRLAARWSPTKITVLTVDHGLRPESASEAEFVAGCAKAAGLPHQVLQWEGDKPATGIQSAARRARYDLMGQWCEANAVPSLLTGHTLDDQAETVLMRLARTSSLDSLAGIPVMGNWGQTRLFRPLLTLRRDHLRGYLRALGQAWIEDPSNSDDRFERARIRKAMPVLHALGITPEALGELAYQAAKAVHGLRSATHAWVKHHVTFHDTGHCTVPLAPFLDQTEALRPRILGWLISRHGAGKIPEPAELELLCNWIYKPGTRRTLGGAIIARRKDHLLIGREPGRIDRATVVVPAGGRVIWDGRFEIEGPPGCEVIAAGTLGNLPRRADIPAFVQASLPAVLSLGKIQSVPHLGLGSGVTVRRLTGQSG